MTTFNPIPDAYGVGFTTITPDPEWVRPGL